MCSFIGLLLHCVTQPLDKETQQCAESSVAGYCNVLLIHLNSKSAMQRMISASVLTEWALLKSGNKDIFTPCIKNRLQQCLLESIYFDEIALSYTKILQDTRDYLLLLKNSSVPVDETLNNKVRYFFLVWVLQLIKIISTRIAVDV